MKTYSRKNSSYLKKAFIGSNFNEMCRLCLSELDMVLTPIFQDSKVSYQEWIQYSVDVLIEEGDGLPPNICEECLVMVEQAYLFKKKCKASDSKLREHLELLELNEECKLNETLFESLSEDHKNLFLKEEPSDNKCDKSSEVDTGGTVVEPAPEQEISQEPPDNEVKEDSTPKDITSMQIVFENDSEPQEKVVINKVQRYILKGEKRGDDQEEDLTVCEIVPLDVKNDESVSFKEDQPKSPVFMDVNEFQNQNGNLESSEFTNMQSHDKTGGRIQEIYQLWDNEDDVELREKEKNDGVIILDVSWEESSDKNEKKQNKGLIEVDVEQNGVVQIHKVYKRKNHLEIETVPQLKTFNCVSCTENFTSFSELKMHLTKVHKETSDTPYCEICSKTFTCVNSLKRHKAVHTGFKPYKCKICEREFSQGSILKRHILTHENQKPYNCHICDKSYTQKMNLLIHLKVHGFRTGADSFQCKLCSKSFVHQSGLSRHVKMHKGIKFLCVHCKKTFNDSSDLARHVKTKHQGLS